MTQKRVSKYYVRAFNYHDYIYIVKSNGLKLKQCICCPANEQVSSVDYPERLRAVKRVEKQFFIGHWTNQEKGFLKMWGIMKSESEEVDG